MITPARVIPYLLILIMGLFIAYQCKSSKIQQLELFQENSRFQEVIEAKTAEISNRDSLISALTSKVALDSVKNSNAMARLKQANSTLSRKIADLRPLLPPETFENDTLAAFVSLQDSLIESQALTIRDQELFFQAHVRDLRDIIALTTQQYEAQKQITAAVTEQLATVDKQARKERRGKNFFKVVSAALATGIVYLSLKE